jgi:precorrin-6A synthase
MGSKMRRKVFVIGIGSGNPDHMTMQAIDALNRVSVFFIPNKGAEKTELARLRRDICERFVANKSYRLVDFDVPSRKQTGPYEEDVKEWHGDVGQVYERLLTQELGEDEHGAFLAWGDPTLYDSVLRILERIAAQGHLDLDYEVIPGISSVQALAAAHRVPLNDIGKSILITTGRRLAEGFPNDADSVVVMLDGQNAFRGVGDDVEIYWGANIGTEDEILISGKLRDVADEIEHARQELRNRRGWVMDTYLLKKPE